ncbi:MAG: SpoIIIAC/SpoIIIAD family protein [Eubacteriales bacterium]
MNILAIVGLAILTAVLATLMRRYHKEYAMLLSRFGRRTHFVYDISKFYSGLKQHYGYAVCFRCFGRVYHYFNQNIGHLFLAQFAADACRDAGESSLASKVELAGKVAVILMALPLFEAIANTDHYLNRGLRM